MPTTVAQFCPLSTEMREPIGSVLSQYRTID
jgi:hypothetical protein